MIYPFISQAFLFEKELSTYLIEAERASNLIEDILTKANIEFKMQFVIDFDGVCWQYYQGILMNLEDEIHLNLITDLTGIEIFLHKK